MQPRIEVIENKMLIGMSLTMSVVNNRTGMLWGQFSPKIPHIPKRTDNNRISLQLYPTHYFNQFNPMTEFEKWACVEVSGAPEIPEGLQQLVLTGGMYAVFEYKGSSNDPAIFQYIYAEWLPNSEYALDNRPHFEVLGKNYRNNDPNSEEDIWIPIVPK